MDCPSGGSGDTLPSPNAAAKGPGLRTVRGGREVD